jgi:phenylpropionate dioxygenase-like ring-hydroxylating dioxygenase large terminal subunit
MNVIKTHYGGYFGSEVPQENVMLTHVGPGTPCGEYLRRFWHPVFHIDDLKDLPVAIRILGQDLVVFRDGAGRIGLLAKHCSHRGASLEFGVIQDHGIRCCYHGWHYDIDGTVLDIPSEPVGSKIKDRFFHGAYPVREFGGLVFTYMGPPDRIPPFPLYDTLVAPGFRLGRGELLDVDNVKPCNWLQVIDNVVDPVHETFLHARSTGYQFMDENGRPVVELEQMPEHNYVETALGIACQVTRRVGADIWVRNVEYICPNIAQISRTPTFPPNYANGSEEIWILPRVTRWRVPIDDTSTREFAVVRLGPGQENPYTENPAPALRSNYGARPYEEMQRTPGDYEAQIGQRSIAIHALERLSSTDRGVAMMRRMVAEGIKAVERGEDPKGLVRTEGTIPTYGYDAVLRVPQAGDPDAESSVLRATAERALQQVMRDPLAARREVVV